VNELESRLLKGRKVMIFGQINDKLARDVVGRILTLAEESSKPIDIFVNSPGGHVESGDSIHDIIRFVRDHVPVRVIGTGWVASAGALIYLGGHKEQRASCCISRWAACGAPRPISTSRRARSSRCASA